MNENEATKCTHQEKFVYKKHNWKRFPTRTYNTIPVNQS